MYCLVFTDDYSRFTWVFFLGTNDETSGTLKSFITRVENLMNLRVKVIRSLVSCDGLGGDDWSDQAEEGPNFSLMAYTSSRLDDFANKHVVENSEAKSSQEKPKEVRKHTDAPIIEEWVSDDEDEEMIQPKFEQKTVKTIIAKIKFVKPKQPEKKARKTVKQLKNQKMVKPVWKYNQMVNHKNHAKKTHPNATKKMVPRVVLLNSGIVNTARQNFSKIAVLVNTARQVNTARPKSTVNAARQMSYLSKSAHSSVKMPIQKNTSFNNSNVNQRVNTLRSKTVNTARPKVVVNVVQDFKLINESQVLLRVPRKNNMYSVDLKNIVPKGCLTCLFGKATPDESKLWHRRLGHLNFKTMNKLVKENLVRGLPSKLFKYDQTCVSCQKGKQHRASCKTKTENSNSLPLHLLHMDLFSPTFVKSLMKKMYCLVVIDDYSRFTRVLFLATKDETTSILKSFITRIENLVDHKVKVIRCDNGTEFKNREMNPFCEMKGSGPDWLFDIDALTRTINYEPIDVGTQSNGFIELGVGATVLVLDHMGWSPGSMMIIGEESGGVSNFSINILILDFTAKTSLMNGCLT
nr:putative ribonuclease H-like domain-containing protein [Tanacetum cinerariifolium]